MGEVVPGSRKKQKVARLQVFTAGRVEVDPGHVLEDRLEGRPGRLRLILSDEQSVVSQKGVVEESLIGLGGGSVLNDRP